MIGSGLLDSTDFERGTMRAGDAQETPTQNHISPTIRRETRLVCESSAVKQMWQISDRHGQILVLAFK